MKKTILAVITALLLATSANAAFTKTNTYQDGTFSDVPASKWYSSEVGGAYELGLMNGVGGGLFNPDGSFTVAEAITLASRARAVYNRETIEPSGEPWYAPYVDYAKKTALFPPTIAHKSLTVRQSALKLPRCSEKLCQTGISSR